ncbi:MAG: hypothetical protein ACHP85_05735 [Burkholderiales bacterium]|jgi:hypothetical protein
MKYPERFGTISSVAPAILKDLKDEPRERTFDTFGEDEAYYDANGPGRWPGRTRPRSVSGKGPGSDLPPR